MPLETTEDFFKLENYLQVLKEASISLEDNGTFYFQNNHVYVVYENNIVPNGTFKLYIFHSTHGYDATCLGPITICHHPTQKSTDFIETIPPIKLAQSPILKDIKPPIFAELIKNNIKNNKDAKLALNKFAKNLIENQHEENKDSSSYIFSFIINNHNLKDFINNIRNTQELVMHHSNLFL
ncbi:37312_t:CDS:2 [Gigaspora margarita]|uniref:37312_t:CDS:1 n=1 Tax=Gigaspora margarita TaxID=4874 RepID=A0ABM8VX98_GIGMA|nr:37312_t:CDS:2 [Gigaspora margarita]